MTDKKRVLMVGQNPDVFSGNGNMMGACLEEIDPNEYEVCVFARDKAEIGLYKDPFNPAPSFDAPLIQAEERETNDPWGRRRLLVFLQQFPVDIVVFVGIDIWVYQDIFDHIKEMQKKMGFTWKVLVPYDLEEVREDWINWLNYPDQVYIYTLSGYKELKDKVPAAKYHRPRLRFNELYQPPSDEDKQFIRKQIFPDVSMDTEIFCFVGNNQIRKNIYNTIAGFAEALKSRNDMMLYMHLDNPDRVFSIDRIKRDFGIPDDKVRHNAHSRRIWPNEMAVVYQAMDCHLLPSLQEGLSWTVVESKLTGLPSILSNNTAHVDFNYEHYKQHLPKPIIPITPDQTELVPLISDFGACYLQANCCSPKAIKNKILQYMGNVRGKKGIDYKSNIQENARIMGESWINACHNFQTDILEDEPEPVQAKSEMEIL